MKTQNAKECLNTKENKLKILLEKVKALDDKYKALEPSQERRFYLDDNNNKVFEPFAYPEMDEQHETDLKNFDEEFKKRATQTAYSEGKATEQYKTINQNGTNTDEIKVCYVCNKKFNELKKLRFAREKEEWFNLVCEKCFESIIKKCEGFN